MIIIIIIIIINGISIIFKKTIEKKKRERNRYVMRNKRTSIKIEIKIVIEIQSNRGNKVDKNFILKKIHMYKALHDQ